MLMRCNELVLKTPVENATRTSIEKHLSWSSDIPPASHFPLHLSRPAKYQPNLQPATVCVESRSGEARHRIRQQLRLLTSSAHQSLRALVMQSSAPAPGVQSIWDSLMGYRRQHLAVPISTNDLEPLKTSTQMAEPRPEYAHTVDHPTTLTFMSAHTTIAWR